MLRKNVMAASLACVVALSLLPGTAAALHVTTADTTFVPAGVRSASYPITPLLTGGILETSREVTLNQGVSVRPADPDPEGCNSRADGQLQVTESTRGSGLVDLGYENVPRASPTAPTMLPVTDTRVSGSMRFEGESWACDGDTPVLAQGGTCTRTFSPGYPGALIEPSATSLEGDPYEVGVSTRVVAFVSYDPGLGCLMQKGEVPMAPGAYIGDYWGDALYLGSFVRPGIPAEQDKRTQEASMAKTDASCVQGEEWWRGQHGAGMYTWTGHYDDYIPDDPISTCSSVRGGYSRTTLERALAINEVRLFQMTPNGDYVEVKSDDHIIDGNTVKIEMLIENRWKRDITAPVQFFDAVYKRKLEPEKGQVNPMSETFVAGGQKKVTFLWRTDGMAWESPGQPITIRNLEITTPYGGAKLTVKFQPRPVLLLHGWNSNPAAWNAWPAFVASVRSPWTVETVKGMNTDPVSGYGIPVNAGVLRASVADIRKRTGAVHVDLIGHSMGGLISRWYLSRMMGAPAQDGRQVVRSLTMFGTPNLGSDCAYEVLGVGAASMLGASVFEEKLAGAVGNYTPTFHLTPAYQVTQFLPRTPPKSGVYYSHRAGIIFPKFACGMPGPLGQSGPNDGPVVLPSVVGLGVGGRQLAPPDFTIHTSMTDDRDYFDSAVTKVLGLGPPEAVKLVSPSRSTRAAREAPPKTGPVPGRWADGASASLGDSARLVLTTPGGRTRVAVLAPGGALVTVRDSQGRQIASETSTDVPMVVDQAMPAGDVVVEVDAQDNTGRVGASLSLPDTKLYITATAKRRDDQVTIAARVIGGGNAKTTVQAVIAMGTPQATVITLKKSGKAYVGSVKVRPGTATIVVGARIGAEQRVTFTALE